MRGGAALVRHRGLVLWCGLATHSAGLAVLGAALLACALALAVHKVRGFAKRR